MSQVRRPQIVDADACYVATERERDAVARVLELERDARLTVLVELKTPSGSLLGKEYRNKAHVAGGDLGGELRNTSPIAIHG